MLRTTTQKGFIFDEFISSFSRKFPDRARFRTGTSYAFPETICSNMTTPGTLNAL